MHAISQASFTVRAPMLARLELITGAVQMRTSWLCCRPHRSRQSAVQHRHELPSASARGMPVAASRTDQLMHQSCRLRRATRSRACQPPVNVLHHRIMPARTLQHYSVTSTVQYRQSTGQRHCRRGQHSRCLAGSRRTSAGARLFPTPSAPSASTGGNWHAPSAKSCSYGAQNPALLPHHTCGGRAALLST